MNKREFLNKLNEYMSYELPQSMVAEKLDFYADYIDKEVSSGRRITDVIDELGDPQLIARSIIDAAKSGPDGIPGTDDDLDFGENIASNGRAGNGYDSGSAYGGNTAGAGSTFTEDGAAADDRREQRAGNNGMHVYQFGCLTAMLIMIAVFAVFGAIMHILSPILAPICIVFLIVWLLNRTTGGRW